MHWMCHCRPLSESYNDFFFKPLVSIHYDKSQPAAAWQTENTLQWTFCCVFIVLKLLGLFEEIKNGLLNSIYVFIILCIHCLIIYGHCFCYYYIHLISVFIFIFIIFVRWVEPHSEQSIDNFQLRFFKYFFAKADKERLIRENTTSASKLMKVDIL